jgi:hypothetical protein
MLSLYDATQSTKYLLLQSLGNQAMRQPNTNALKMSFAYSKSYQNIS